MESPKNLENQESFADFFARMEALFKSEGFSSGVKAEIDEWQVKNVEADKEGKSAEERLRSDIQLAQIHIAIGRNDLALEVLEFAWDYARGMGLEDIVREINILIEPL